MTIAAPMVPMNVGCIFSPLLWVVLLRRISPPPYPSQERGDVSSSQFTPHFTYGVCPCDHSADDAPGS